MPSRPVPALPPYTFDDFCAIDREVTRAVSTLGRYADPSTLATLKAAENILSRLRHASLFLCDPTLPEDDREIVEHDVLSLFSCPDAK
jgi:hypothetical protein